MSRRLRLAGVSASCAALCACTVGPDFVAPRTSSPAHFAPSAHDVPSTPREAAIDETWWRAFRDPELDTLVERLARQNLDLQVEAERIAEARAQRTIARSQGLPHVGANYTYTRERLSKNGTTSLLEPTPGAPLEFDLDDPRLQASWDVDLFGRVRRAVEAAGADTQARIEARRALTLAALADLAQTYMRLRGVQAREEVVQRNQTAADNRKRLVHDRLRDGVATLSDVAQADAQAATIGEDLPSLVESEARLVNALGLLLAEPPRALRAELFPHKAQPQTPPSVPVGLPSELLRRRPDLREAEARLHAATAQTGVAVAQFYPDVNLTGNFGTESLRANQLFDFASRQFMAGPSVSLPIFQGGQLRGQLQLRRAEQREAALTYRSTVLQAWRDVDDALTAYGEIQHRRRNVEGVERDDAVALRVAEQRWRQGVDSFIDVTVAQAQLYAAQDADVQAETDLEVALVALYRALGGGWRAAEPAVAAK